jgi:hypothetical protein
MLSAASQPLEFPTRPEAAVDHVVPFLALNQW